MNIRKLKLALTVQLMNLDFSPRSLVRRVAESLQNFREDTGRLIAFKLLDRQQLGTALECNIYELAFEHCTIAIEVVENHRTGTHTVKGFQFIERRPASAA